MSSPRSLRGHALSAVMVTPERLGRLLVHVWLLGACILCANTAAARPLDEMMASHRFSVCAADNALPYSSRDGAMPGFYLDLAHAIAQALGLELHVDWIASSEQIRFTSCDAVMAVPASDDGVASDSGDINKLRPRLLTMPYMAVSTLLVLPGQPADGVSLAALRRSRVAVPSGSVAHQVLNEAGVPVWVRFRNDVEILDAVKNGQADAGVVSQIGFGWYRKNNPETTLAGIDNVLDAPGLRFKVAIALRRTNLATVHRIDTIMRQLRHDGTIATILQKYGITFLPRDAAPDQDVSGGSEARRPTKVDVAGRPPQP
ncbi:substrate-binding periplasmic protein [Rugamonas apoptosis]|uniref:Transporter substrate-binding domain-containing protein n=1 Tax=Rugamonas apoptosis TaxID=2758570 RepID=A0A7W2FBQ2_9BURK|nr:transporter substrate-binding domain-containing protein [Rugamonas apoptosis]MBA5688694.1 transporter substrate-binding domain-containing protein [Rugamonas apoptosis]